MKNSYLLATFILICMGCKQTSSPTSETTKIDTTTNNTVMYDSLFIAAHVRRVSGQDTIPLPPLEHTANGRNGCVPFNKLGLSNYLFDHHRLITNRGTAEGIIVEEIHMHIDGHTKIYKPGFIHISSSRKTSWNNKLNNGSLCSNFYTHGIGICDTDVDSFIHRGMTYYTVRVAGLLCSRIQLDGTTNENCAPEE